MATRKQTSRKEAPPESTLSAAKAIGTPAGATPEALPAAKSVKKGKLAPKHKSRLPRRQKKALRKVQASQ